MARKPARQMGSETLMLGKVLSFARRRAKSRYADDAAVSDFTRVCVSTGILDHGNTARVEAGIQQGASGEPGAEASIKNN